MIFQVAFNLVDAFFIGKLGTDAFAAVNLASFSIWLLSAIVGVVGTGANALVAQAVGAKDTSKLAAIRSQALRASLLLGFITMAIGLWGSSQLTLFMSGNQSSSLYAATLADQYLCTILLAAPILCLNESLSAIYRGQGDTRTPTIILSLGFFLNAVLDPILIFGLGPLPGLGVVGAALASNCSFLFSLFLFVMVRRDWFPLKEGLLSRPFGELARILRIGFPPSFTNIIFCVIYMLVTPAIASQGTEALAALGLGHKVISISYFLCLSFSLAAITLTGESTGAGDREEAIYRSWVVVTTSTVANATVGLVLVMFASDICGVFSKDASVLEMAISYLYIVVPSQVFLGIGMSVEGAFAGFGKTTLPMVVSVLTTLIRWPAAIWIVAHTTLGIDGVWWAFAISTYLRSLGLLALLFFDQKNHS